MSDFNEFETVPKKTNYKEWAFKFFVYMFLLNVLVFYMAYKGSYQPLAIVACSLLATLLLFAGIILTIISIKNKEEKNYQYHVSLWGYSIFILLTIFSIIYSSNII